VAAPFDPAANIQKLSLDHVYPGFVWAQNSCALDTVCVTLLYCMYQLPVNDQRLHAWDLLPKLKTAGSIRLATDLEFNTVASVTDFTVSNMETFKVQFLNAVYNDKNKKESVVLGNFLSLADIFEELYKHPDTGTDLFCDTLHFQKNLVYACSCGTSRTSRSRVYNYMPLTIVDQRPNLSALVEGFYADVPPLLSKCNACARSVEGYVTTTLPYILLIDITSMTNVECDATIDPHLQVQGKGYRLFSVNYFGGNHFTAKIRIADSVYQYDGLTNGALEKCNGSDFHYRYQLLNKTKTAQILWYIQE
jgi:hypothetical protein